MAEDLSPGPGAPVRWSYKTVRMYVGQDNFDDQLDSIGYEGWELVYIRRINAEYEDYVFKRPSDWEDRRIDKVLIGQV